MHLTHHKINERESRPSPEILYYMRHFWYIYLNKEEDKSLQFNLETRIVKPELSFAIRFHIGNLSSETPWDGHIKLFGSAIYWSFSGCRRLASWITSTKEKPWNSRDIWVRNDKSTLYLHLWTQSDLYSERRKKRGKYRRSWRDRSYSLSPAEWLWGPLRYSYEDLDTVATTLDLKEGSYPVVLTLQRCFLKRVKSKRIVQEELVIDVDAPNGIPSHYDSSGGYKGDRTYGFSVKFPRERRYDWAKDALMLVEAWVLKSRGRTGFREAQEVEFK